MRRSTSAIPTWDELPSAKTADAAVCIGVAKESHRIREDKEAPRSTRNGSSVRAEYSIHFEVRQPAITTGNTCLLRFNPSGSLA
jgi:hypothetical protein